MNFLRPVRVVSAGGLSVETTPIDPALPNPAGMPAVTIRPVAKPSFAGAELGTVGGFTRADWLWFGVGAVAFSGLALLLIFKGR